MGSRGRRPPAENADLTVNETSAELNYVNYDSMPTMDSRWLEAGKGE